MQENATELFPTRSISTKAKTKLGISFGFLLFPAERESYSTSTLPFSGCFFSRANAFFLLVLLSADKALGGGPEISSTLAADWRKNAYACLFYLRKGEEKTRSIVP
jgi:hypothetical protein